jgi:hypothetical protein
MKMNNILKIILQNKIPVLIGVFVLSTYSYATFSGNRICDCEKVEKEKNSRIRRFYNSNHYNHK